MMTGVYTPTEGKIYLTDKQGTEHDITGMRPDKISHLGIAVLSKTSVYSKK